MKTDHSPPNPPRAPNELTVLILFRTEERWAASVDLAVARVSIGNCRADFDHAVRRSLTFRKRWFGGLRIMNEGDSMIRFHCIFFYLHRDRPAK
jgi:hypothetical protein